MPDPEPDQACAESLADASVRDSAGHLNTVVFEDLSLGQALGYLFWRPIEASRLFWRVLTYEGAADNDQQVDVPPDEGDGDEPDENRGAAPDSVAEFPVVAVADRAGGVQRMMTEGYELAPVSAAPALAAGRTGSWHAVWSPIVVMAAAVLLALRGGAVLHAAALDPASHAARTTNGAFLWLVAAGALVVGYALDQGSAWWQVRFPRMSAWLYGQLAGSSQRAMRNGGLVVALIAALWLAVVGAGTAWLAVALLVLSSTLWLALVLGNAPRPATPDRAVNGQDDSLHDRAGAEEQVVIRSQTAAPRAASRSGAWLSDHAVQLALVPVALVLSAAAYALNVQRDALDRAVDVVLTPGGFAAWVASILAWLTILAVDVRSLPNWWRHLSARAIVRRLRLTWTGAALIAVMALGAAFRVFDLDSTPPEMTSDHIEKLLDALRVSDGYRGVFFPNNGGREGFQMVVVAAIADWFGVGFSFRALKLASAIEGVITLPALWWMARQVWGTATDRDRQVGNWVGLALAGLVAVSGWHVMLSRLGLRIVLTPLTTALALGFLARAMRHNRRRDYAALGLILGAGVYFYQANRMLPVVVVIGVGLALLRDVRSPGDLLRRTGEVLGFAALTVSPMLVYWYLGQVLEQSGYTNTRDLGERLDSLAPLFAMAWLAILALIARARRGDTVLQTGGGLLATTVIALAVFIPLYRYSEINPHDFWNRTRGRLFGEDAFIRLDPAVGVAVPYDPTIGEQFERFWDQRDVFEQNLEDALRMFHWEGDGAWINNAFARPALSALPGGLMLLGLVMWGIRLARSRDPVAWLLPIAGLIMLLPSALTLAYTIENPSFTRASGAIPVVFLLAALPLGTLCWRLSRIPWRIADVVPAGALIAVLLVGGVLWRDLDRNWDAYFTGYRLNYSNSWKPYSEIAGPLREFAQGEGSYGNAFMVAYPHWLDHRILGTMAGDIRWPNGLVTREDLFGQMRANAGTRYAYDPQKPLFVMFNAQDAETADYLATLLPGGSTELYEYQVEGSSQTGSFYVYRVQAGTLEQVGE